MDHPAAHERHPSFRVDSLFYGSPRLFVALPLPLRFFQRVALALEFYCFSSANVSAALSKHNAPRAAGLL